MVTLDDLSGKMDRVIDAVIHLHGDVTDIKEQMVTREQFDEALTREDAMMVILQRIDQKRVATIAWFRRLESDMLTLKHHPHLA